MFAALAQAHERRVCYRADANAVLRAFMAMSGYGQKNLAKALGSTSRAWEILHGKRPMTMLQLRTLNLAWGLPTDAIAAAEQA